MNGKTRPGDDAGTVTHPRLSKTATLDFESLITGDHLQSYEQHMHNGAKPHREK
jgi:hypothetical protein